MFDRFAPDARQAILQAQVELRRLEHDYIGTEHILLGVLGEREGIGARALAGLGIDLGVVRRRVEETVGKGTQKEPPGHVPFTPQAKNVLELAFRESMRLGHTYIGTEHLLLALVREGEDVAARILLGLGADIDTVWAQVVRLLQGAKKGSALAAQQVGAYQFARELTKAAREGTLDPVLGRDEEIRRLTQILMLRTRNNAMLVGEPGVGKTAVVEGLAQEVARGASSLGDVQLYAIDLGTAGNGAGQAEFAKWLQVLRQEIRGRKNIVLFLEGLARLLGANAAAALEPALGQGELRIVGAMTPAEYQAFLDMPVLARRFQAIRIPELTVAATVEILRALRDRYQAHHGVVFAEEALTAAAELADRRVPDRPMPGKAIDLLDLAGAQVRMRAAAETSEPAQAAEVGRAEVAAAVAGVAGGGDPWPGPRREPPAETGHDPEIWAMS